MQPVEGASAVPSQVVVIVAVPPAPSSAEVELATHAAGRMHCVTAEDLPANEEGIRTCRLPTQPDSQCLQLRRGWLGCQHKITLPPQKTIRFLRLRQWRDEGECEAGAEHG
jgi:hypothetical protein